MSSVSDVLFGIAFAGVVALAGWTLFGEVPGCAIWRVLFFGLAGGYVFGYYVSALERSAPVDGRKITPRRYR